MLSTSFRNVQFRFCHRVSQRVGWNRWFRALYKIQKTPRCDWVGWKSERHIQSLRSLQGNCPSFDNDKGTRDWSSFITNQVRYKHQQKQRKKSGKNWKKQKWRPWEETKAETGLEAQPRDQPKKGKKVSDDLAFLFQDTSTADDELKILFGDRDFTVPFEVPEAPPKPENEAESYERKTHYREERHKRWQEKQAQKQAQKKAETQNGSTPNNTAKWFNADAKTDISISHIPGEETREGAKHSLRRHQQQKARARELKQFFSEDIQKKPKRPARHKKKGAKKPVAKPPPTILKVQIPPHPLTVHELARRCNKKVSEVLAKAADLGEQGLEENGIVEPDVSELVALDFGLEAVRLTNRDLTKKSATEKAEKEYPSRPPVICVMGHVDHGKTTLLDYLRKANVAEKEAGGITQRLAAFSVRGSLEGGGEVTFLDTPGHAAFKKMRSSGAQVTDIVCLVIAADDGISQQTKEVLNLVKEHKLNLVVAITKIDKPGVNIDEAKERIQNQLLENGYNCESYGGTVPVVCVSGVTGEGVSDLTELLSLQSEVLELQADPKGQAEAMVLDSWVDRGLGVIADVVVTWGEIKVGDPIVVGPQSAKVRRIIGADGKMLKAAGPSMPARIMGLKELPNAGDEILGTVSEAEGRRISNLRQRQSSIKQMLNAKIIIQEQPTEEDESEASDIEESETPSGPIVVPIVIKADADGVLDAVVQAIEGAGDEKVQPSVIYAAVGAVTKRDIDIASSTGESAPIFSFGVGMDGNPARQAAKRQGINVYRHDVIYHLIDDVKQKLSEYLPSLTVEETIGTAEVLQMFKMTGSQKGKYIAGCRVTKGKLQATDHFRVLREGAEVYSTSSLSSLRHHKEKVSEVKKGMECGLAFNEFTELKPGDQIECYRVEEVSQSV